MVLCCTMLAESLMKSVNRLWVVVHHFLPSWSYVVSSQEVSGRKVCLLGSFLISIASIACEWQRGFFPDSLFTSHLHDPESTASESSCNNVITSYPRANSKWVSLFAYPILPGNQINLPYAGSQKVCGTFSDSLIACYIMTNRKWVVPW